MNTIVAACGCSVIAVGAPYSNARVACEQSPCGECAKFIHCCEHEAFSIGCYWCNVDKQAFARMTDQERELWAKARGMT